MNVYVQRDGSQVMIVVDGRAVQCCVAAAREIRDKLNATLGTSSDSAEVKAQ
jgi:transketolase C-terminal domain/subunit